MKRSEVLNIIKKSLVKCGIFSDDVPEWLNNAANDLLKDLIRAKVIKYEKK